MTLSDVALLPASYHARKIRGADVGPPSEDSKVLVMYDIDAPAFPHTISSISRLGIALCTSVSARSSCSRATHTCACVAHDVAKVEVTKANGVGNAWL